MVRMINLRCIFCDQIFPYADTPWNDEREHMEKALQIHVFEHHHVTLEKYKEIEHALFLRRRFKLTIESMATRELDSYNNLKNLLEHMDDDKELENLIKKICRKEDI